ncbi:GNAT family N-acetyltransferase [Chloroflexota bacterium]
MSLVSRARKLWAFDGLSGLLHGVVRFVRTPLRRICHRADYYVHEFDLALLSDEYAYPLAEGLEVHVIESDGDANRLANSGYEDFRLVAPYSGTRLRSGAVGFCAYIDRRVAHTAWVGLTDVAKQSFDSLPYAVDFDHGEGCSGGSWTFPAYRGKGIYRHVMWHRLRYLRDHGCTLCRDATEVNNAPGIVGQAVFPSRIKSTLHLVRVLGIERYRVREML